MASFLEGSYCRVLTYFTTKLISSSLSWPFVGRHLAFAVGNQSSQVGIHNFCISGLLRDSDACSFPFPCLRCHRRSDTSQTSP